MRDLLDRHGLDPSRALGQNFLCDPGTIDKIVRLSGVSPGDHVVEVGPGLGSLTVGLADAGATVLAVELDRHLIPALREVVAGVDSGDRPSPVTIVVGDALTLDWESTLDAAAPAGTDWSVVANLPYNVATPLVLDLLAAQPRFVRWLVMVQKEVGERLAAGPGSKAYGIPSVLTAYWATARVVGSVSPQVFLPQPRVDSALVRLDRHATPPVEAPFDELALLTAEQIEAAGVAPTARAEELTLEDWGRLTDVRGSTV